MLLMRSLCSVRYDWMPKRNSEKQDHVPVAYQNNTCTMMCPPAYRLNVVQFRNQLFYFHVYYFFQPIPIGNVICARCATLCYDWVPERNSEI